MAGVHGAGTVEVDVAAINMKDLPSGVGGAWRGNEGDHIGDLFNRRGASAKGDGIVELLAGLFGVWSFSEPVFVEWGNDFGGDHAIDADAISGQIERPFTGQRVHAALGCRIPRGAALASHRALATDIDDDSLAFNQCIKAVVGERENLHEIALQGGLKFCHAMSQADRIVAAGVIDNAIDASVLFQDGLHGFVDGGLVGQFQLVKFSLSARFTNFVDECLARFG